MSCLLTKLLMSSSAAMCIHGYPGCRVPSVPTQCHKLETHIYTQPTMKPQVQNGDQSTYRTEGSGAVLEKKNPELLYVSVDFSSLRSPNPPISNSNLYIFLQNIYSHCAPWELRDARGAEAYCVVNTAWEEQGGEERARHSSYSHALPSAGCLSVCLCDWFFSQRSAVAVTRATGPLHFQLTSFDLHAT